VSATLARTLEAFFKERLMGQRHVSPHTVDAYRDTFKLLFAFVQDQSAKAPSSLGFEDVDAALVGSFLQHLEVDRGNSARTRNVRLAAIHSFFRFAALRHPEHAQSIQRVLAIPTKRGERALVSFLNDDEVTALLAAPDQTQFIGRRDHALLLLALQSGMRVSELVGLRRGDVVFDVRSHVRCTGKGRKERTAPLTKVTTSVLRRLLAEHDGIPDSPLFANTHGSGPLSRSAVTKLVARHARTAGECCVSLRQKNVTPHVLRHTAAIHQFCNREVTSPQSRSGSVTSQSKRLRSTSTRISRSKNKPSIAPPRSAKLAVAIDRPTRCSPCSTPCDYAENFCSISVKQRASVTVST
jgi:integrase/recombinase XerD